MLRALFFILLFAVISCHSSEEEYEESFDIPLIRQNNELLLLGEYDLLIQLNKQYYQLADKMGYEDGKGLCYINLAYVNMKVENYPKSRIFLEHAGKILKDSKNPIHQAKFYLEYGQLKGDFKSYERYVEYNNRALEYAAKSKDSWLKNHVLSIAYARTGTFFLKKKQYDKSLEYYHKAQKVSEPGDLDNNIGDLYLHYQKNLDSARIYLSRAIERYNKNGRKTSIATVTYLTMGEYYTEVKNYDEAEKMYLKALELDKTTRRTYGNITQYIYNELRKTYEKKGEKEKAYFYLRDYLKVKNGANRSVLSAINQDMDEFIFETEQSTQKNRNNILVLALVGFSIFTFSGLYSWETIIALRKRKIHLKNKTEELKEQMDNTIKEQAIELAKNHDPSFLQAFRNAYPGFIEKVLKIDPGLEESELVFCAMLKLHFSSKEIAGYTFIQHRTVQQKKYRMRKKLNIPQDMDIYLFFDHLA